MPYYPEKKPEESGETQRNTSEKRLRLLRLSIAVFSCLLVLYGAIRLILYQSDLNASRNTSMELRELQHREESTPEPTALPTPEATAMATPIPSVTETVSSVACLFFTFAGSSFFFWPPARARSRQINKSSGRARRFHLRSEGG